MRRCGRLLLTGVLALLGASAFNVDTAEPLVLWADATKYYSGFGQNVELRRDKESASSLFLEVPYPTSAIRASQLCYYGNGSFDCASKNFQSYTRGPDDMNWSIPLSTACKSTQDDRFLEVIVKQKFQKLYYESGSPSESESINETPDKLFCEADFNSDGKTDFLIAQKDNSQTIQVNAMISQKQGDYHAFEVNGLSLERSQFGRSISCIGDVNLDGFQDVAIGAPGENDGKGAVYIYHGSATGLIPQYSQRISAMDLLNGTLVVKGFGISISAGVDIDDNGYVDLAVGASRSSQVAVLRSRPVVLLASSDSKVGLPEAVGKSVDISDCIEYTGERLPDSIRVRVEVSATVTAVPQLRNTKPARKRVFQDLQLSAGSLECANLHLSLGGLLKVTQAVVVKVDLEYSIENLSERVGFCECCPVLEPKSANRSLGTYRITCNRDGSCQSSTIAGITMVTKEESKVTVWIWVTVVIAILVSVLLIALSVMFVIRRRRRKRVVTRRLHPPNKPEFGKGTDNDRHSLASYDMPYALEMASYDDAK